MPVKRLDTEKGAPDHSGAFLRSEGAKAPHFEILLWPNRSLSRRGFVAFIGITSALIAVPLLSVLGTPVLWALMPFLALAVAGVWYAIERNYTDGRLTERLSLSRDAIRLVRENPRGPVQEWSANPYWTRLQLHEKGGPVTNYLTLEGNGRTVELGAFLSPEERAALHEDLSRRLSLLNHNAPG